MSRRGVVICLDDEAMILTSLHEQLRPLLEDGLRVEVSHDGEEALELLEELLDDGDEVPLFISDQIMPGLKGDQVLKEVAARSPQTRTVLLTGQADLEAVQRAVNEARLYRYISKPWERADLLLTARGAVSSYRQERELAARRAEIEETNAVFRRFVPPAFLSRIAARGLAAIELGTAETLEVTVLFSDLRGFTTLSERLAPPDLLLFLNSYFEVVSAPIHAGQGAIDKFIGDAVMAIFEGEGHAARAVEAALGMLDALRAWSATRPEPVRAGVGLHSGVVVLGTVGTRDRMSSTVLGDTVNVAARLESQTKERGCELLVSEQTLRAAGRAAGGGGEGAAPWAARLVDRAPVKGRAEEVAFYAVERAPR